MNNTTDACGLAGQAEEGLRSLAEAIFRVPVGDLFAGVYEKEERAAARHARLMKKRVGTGRRSSDRKLKLLAEMAQGRGSKNDLSA